VLDWACIGHTHPYQSECLRVACGCEPTSKATRKVRGIFDVDQNTLAVQPDSGGTMLAEVDLTGDRLKFKMIGGPENDPGLEFSK
jgi:hypothetical protein